MIVYRMNGYTLPSSCGDNPHCVASKQRKALTRMTFTRTVNARRYREVLSRTSPHTLYHRRSLISSYISSRKGIDHTRTLTSELYSVDAHWSVITGSGDVDR